jgi:predicted O-methyltransferase YrrM
MCKTFIKDLFDPVCFAISKKRFRKLEKTLKTPATRLAIPFVFKGEGHYRRIAPIQAHEEIAALYRAVCALKPRIVLEIGTCHGGSLYLWCQAADSEATIVSVDLPGGKFGGGYHASREKFYTLFAKRNQKLHLLREDSHTESSLAKVKGFLGGGLVDFLFIDGDHGYTGVKKDYELYSPLVRSGGLIGFHDILPSPPETGMEVWKYWQEIKSQAANAREFINEDPGDRKIGIGLIKRD